MDAKQFEIEQHIKALYDRFQSGSMTRQMHKELKQFEEKYNIVMESNVSNGNTGEEVSRLLDIMLSSVIR